MDVVKKVQAYFHHANEDLRASRTMFWMGFCGLPFMWLLNWLQHRTAAAAPDSPKELKQLVRLSFGFAIISFAVLVSWMSYFQGITESMVCPCEAPWGSDMRCHCTLGDNRIYQTTGACVDTNGQCEAR
mmetsp:Transcript_31068/g.73281  ORF Transcript_31068/g.73281 Transcript_31068/m.73281 type:complete len:129 (-) Transcript_31068:81-467(-)